MSKSLLIFTLSFHIVVVSAFSQQHDVRISLDYDNISLSQLIDTIRVKSNLKIAYDVNSIPSDSLMAIHTVDKNPVELLTELLTDSAVEILQEGNQIVIRDKGTRVNKYFELAGYVVDSKGMPLPMVNISFINRPLGSVTNDAGEFELKVPVNFRGDTLFFSSLGYETVGIPVLSSDTVIDVTLLETSVSLPEVTIKYKDVDEIVKLFMEKQKDNYFENSTLFTAFFRETIKQDERYVNVSEAVLQVLKCSYIQPFKLEHVKFVKGRKFRDVEKMQCVNFRMEGGPFYFSRIDIARYMDFFPVENAAVLYKYRLEGLDYEYDRLVYLVSFVPIDDNGELLYKGVLRIDTESFALISAQFELTKNSLRYSRKYLIRKEAGKLKAKPLYARYSISYRPYKNRWVLNKLIGELKVYVNDKKSRRKSMFTAVTEMLMSDFKNAGKTKFKSSEIYKSKYILTDEIKSYDPEFWKDYNVIKPDEDIENVFKRPDVE
jgi:hypothetical protein